MGTTRNGAARVEPRSRDDNPAKVIEGEWHGDRVVIIEFADEQPFRDGYDSPEHQEALKVRLDAADSRAALVHGISG